MLQPCNVRLASTRGEAAERWPATLRASGDLKAEHWRSKAVRDDTLSSSKASLIHSEKGGTVMNTLTLFFVILFTTLLLAGGLRFTMREIQRLSAESEDRGRNRRPSAGKRFGLVR